METGTNEGKKFLPYTTLDFQEIERMAGHLADIIESRFDALADILSEYESYEVINDEITLTLDLLRNIQENREYFQLRIGAVTSFLPRNQPLYSLTCFVIVPAFMASEVHFRVHHSMLHFFPRLLDLLDVHALFPNTIVSKKERLEFLTERSALLVNPRTGETRPATDAVIFTGTPIHADQLRFIFGEQTLFIANGSGHNPVVVSSDADLSQAVAAALAVQFYNQGQDCAAPNAILVHKDVAHEFLRMLRAGVSSLKIGTYRDKLCRIGPISDPKDLIRIQDFLIEHRAYIDPSTPGVIRTQDAIVEPTIIYKPLKEGGNFREIFAPIIFVQEYDDDSMLARYFEDAQYAPHAMYVTLYGESDYVKNLIDRPMMGEILHNISSFIHNTHLHAPGKERGTEPFGGYGRGASSVSMNGSIISMPTLPQRDIYEMIAKPLLSKKTTETHQDRYRQFTEIKYKNVQKLLKIKRLQKKDENHIHEENGGVAYIDRRLLAVSDGQYIALKEDDVYRLLREPNLSYIGELEPEDAAMIVDLAKTLRRIPEMSAAEFRATLYEIPKDKKVSDEVNKKRQTRFFRHVYRLLFDKDSGPPLALFLADAEQKQLRRLLDINGYA